MTTSGCDTIADGSFAARSSSPYQEPATSRTRSSADTFSFIRLIKTFNVKTVRGDDINIPPKAMDEGHRYWIGGTIFGLGWALAGACPGPLFALIGNGILVMAVAVVSAVAGTWAYGALRPRLPH